VTGRYQEKNLIRRIISSFSKAHHHTGGKDIKRNTESSSEEKNGSEKTVESEAHISDHASKKRGSQRLKSVRTQSSGKKKPFSKPPKQGPETKARSKWDLVQFQVPPSKEKTRFHDLDLPLEIMHGIFELGFEYCTPIQAEILPKTLTGADAFGRAQTGTGKSAAFLITVLTRLMRNPPKTKRRPGEPRALIVVPTRELALQVKKDANLLGKYTSCKVVAVFGGMDYQKQQKLLAEKVIDVVVATPGRLLDFKRRGDAHLDKVEILVIDEADQMLDMGFIPDVRQIIHSTPSKTARQTMLFGATLTPEVTRLASQWTREPVTVDIEPEQVTVETVDQIIYLVTADERFTVLYNMITLHHLNRVIIFCNRRDQTRKLADRLRNQGIRCEILSGEVAQKRRIRTLEGFRSGKIRVLVATDVAGRGIHVEGISHVVNYNLPLDPEDYVHRIGRTGRAGVTGTSISFATESESFQLPGIESFIGQKLPCVYPENQLLTPLPSPVRGEDASKQKFRRSRPKSRRRSGGTRKHK